MQCTAGNLVHHQLWQLRLARQTSWPTARVREKSFMLASWHQSMGCARCHLSQYEDDEKKQNTEQCVLDQDHGQGYALAQPLQAHCSAFRFCQILYDNGQIKPVAVSSANQHTDIGTKAVAAQILNRHLQIWLVEILP